MENLNKILLISIISLTFSCGTYFDIASQNHVYEDHPHSTEIYYNGIDIYWGYHTGFYYYYGVPHFYPWWYYYQFIPPYHYYTHSHVHVHCSNGHYVYGHRGPTLNNNVVKDFTPTIKVKNNKDKSFVFPRDWKSSNSTRINKQNNNKINYNRTFNNGNSSKVNNKRNNNFNNNKNNNKIKVNNGSKRTSKTNTSRKPKR